MLGYTIGVARSVDFDRRGDLGMGGFVHCAVNPTRNVPISDFFFLTR